jgi:hypothetical protein
MPAPEPYGGTEPPLVPMADASATPGLPPERPVAPGRTAGSPFGPYGPTGPLFPPTFPYGPFGGLGGGLGGATYSGDPAPMPTGEEMRTVAALRADLQKEYAALGITNKPARIANTQALLDRALAEADLVSQYAMLEQAYEQATSLVNYSLAKQILAEISARFEVDQLQRRMDFVKEFARRAKIRNEIHSVAVDAMQLADQALSAERYAEAESLAGMANQLARNSNDAALAQQAKQLEVDIRKAKRTGTTGSTESETEIGSSESDPSLVPIP